MNISQREAKRLKKRVAELERTIRQQRQRWSNDYPGGVHLGDMTRARDWFSGRIESARMLGHAVIVTETGNDIWKFYALPLPIEPA